MGISTRNKEYKKKEALIVCFGAFGVVGGYCCLAGTTRCSMAFLENLWA
jgi:hypothetical protein